MNIPYFLCRAILCLLVTTLIQAGELRRWTNAEGKVIEAEYLRSDDSHVTLLIRGKEVKYALNKLSENDRNYVLAQAKTLAVASSDAKTGWMEHVPVPKPAFATNKEYLGGSNAKAIYKAFATGNTPQIWEANKGSVEEQFSYKNGAMIVYVPPTYDASKPMGVYMHISPGDDGELSKEYAPIMNQFSLIYVSPKGTSNGQPMLRRVKLAVDALAAVKESWKVDDKRVCVGGLSGGGHIAMLTHAMFPQWFKASISHAAQSYLPSGSTSGHFPGLDQRDITGKECKDHKWVVISGDKDFNYQEILKTGKLWEDARANYRFMDVPGMGHTNASPDKLAEAIKWIGF
jgi:hypothetical protein